MHGEDLINRLKQGDETAFKILVENYRDQVVNTCFGLLHNYDDAEDVAQDVFVEAYRSIHRFRGDSQINTWLYRIAINRSLNHIRNNKKRRHTFAFDSSDGNSAKEEAAESTANPDYPLESAQRAEMLHLAIDALPENQRIAFTLNKYEDLSYEEIAQVMKLSISSVDSLLYRARLNLQKKLYSCYKKNNI